jgi:uncharacterized YigZ family protein
MAAEYLTIRETGKGEYEEKKSRFLGEAVHVETEEEAAAYVAGIRKQYYDARHHCYAWVMGEGAERKKSADDGEPSGTAGKPILGQIHSKELTNVLVIVVRYFGGVKLGTSGLIVAYRAAAAEALEAVPHIEKTINGEIVLRFSYPLLNDVLRIVKEEEPKVVEQVFDNDCMVRLSMRLSRLPRLIERYEKLVIASKNDLKIEKI